MMRFSLTISTMFAITFFVNQPFIHAASNDKPVIVLCAFGTSTKAMSTYEHIEKVMEKQSRL
ncbi:MAG: hypothetical protein H8D67_28080 [Deltaproteobacteria bacterium]|nr:hypothetical protein [Deltaproteobacteria bacterium]